ncbi:MAG: universal stress protein, partial [Motiliproteus sp.]|nr:universal stress protein [Motiliproteus sp.]
MSLPEQLQQQEGDQTLTPLPEYRSILVAADASDHSNQGVKMAALLGQTWQSKITGAHVYAAKLHDVRFRQMEGGLPEQYKEETELERQRDIHDELITKGLSVITDSYLDGAEATCTDAGLEYIRRSLEGKNYREMVRETNCGKYDLLVMGSLGLGAVEGSRIGTVCERVVRRTDIDTLIIKEAKRDLTEGPIVVAVDGSSRGYAGLLSAFAIHKAQGTPVHVISAYDPYYHYVAFNRIAEVLSEEAGKVFRFKEQEELHEDEELSAEGETSAPDEIEMFGTPVEDAHRRDLTVNALFYNIADFSVIDHIGGLADLQAQIIRTIGPPRIRFEEDPV